MIATIVIVAAFNNATQLTNAYGFAVATVMFTTTVLIAMQIRYVKHLSLVVSILFFGFFGFFDGEQRVQQSPRVLALTLYQVSSGARR
jgi:KUP system potassium uptake protein